MKRRKKLAKGHKHHQPHLPISWYLRMVTPNQGKKRIKIIPGNTKEGRINISQNDQYSLREARPVKQKYFLKTSQTITAHS